MTDRDALLRAIRADPDADTPRLVYADWLEENGHPEAAEFIRVQVELEPVRHRLDDPHVRDLIRRADEIEHGLNDPWAPPAVVDPSVYWTTRFRRGLADSAQVDVQTLLSHGADLRAEYPTVRELAVFDFGDGSAALAGCPALAGLDVIELACHLGPDDITSLMTCPHLRRVETLRLWIGWSDGLAELLTAGPDRPARIELVQLLGGVTAGGRADVLDAAADALVRRVNAVAGRELAHVVRPFDRLFPLCGRGKDDEPGVQLGGEMFAGRLPDGTPAVAGPTDYGLMLAVARLHPDGRPARIETVTSIGPTPIHHAKRDDLHRWLTGTRGLSAALVQVREFSHAPGFGVTLWSDQQYVADDGGWQVIETELYEWMADGSFWLGEQVADWRGRIVTN